MVTSQEYLTITCNGESRQVATGTTVASLIRQLNLDPGQMAVELDGKVLAPEEVAATELAADSRVELIRFVGGG